MPAPSGAHAAEGRSGRQGRFLLIAGWASAILITALDIYGLPDSLKAAWQVIIGG